jgi:hypothetical protein
MNLRVNIFEQNKKDRTKGKILIVKQNDVDLFLADSFHKLKITSNPKNGKAYLLDGTELKTFENLKDGDEIIIVPKKGEEFVKLDEKKKN